MKIIKSIIKFRLLSYFHPSSVKDYFSIPSCSVYRDSYPKAAAITESLISDLIIGKRNAYKIGRISWFLKLYESCAPPIRCKTVV